MATQYQNTLTIGRYIVQESLSVSGTFSIHVEDTEMKKEALWENLSLEQFDRLIGLLSYYQNTDLLGLLEKRKTN